MGFVVCVRCGLKKSGEKSDHFVCDNCIKFSKFVNSLWNGIDTIFKHGSPDPDVHEELYLLADAGFLTHQNPQTAIFYGLSALIVESALMQKPEITEVELNRKVSTTRGWGDTFKLFEELEIVSIRTDQYQRILEIQEKARKIASYLTLGAPLDEQVKKRVSHIFTGYILLRILEKISNLASSEDLLSLPYNQRPRTLWTVLMYLWQTAYDGYHEFSEEDMRRFLSRRGVPSRTLVRIFQVLEHVYGRTTTGLTKDVRFEDGERRFIFSDYVPRVMERLRTREREREERRRG
jgi:hypothetical protein